MMSIKAIGLLILFIVGAIGLAIAIIPNIPGVFKGDQQATNNIASEVLKEEISKNNPTVGLIIDHQEQVPFFIGILNWLVVTVTGIFSFIIEKFPILVVIVIILVGLHLKPS